MSGIKERQRLRNEDLLLRVSPAIDRSIWDENRYEAFVDELCGSREFQKDAIKTAMRYLLGGRYSSLRELARENYNDNNSSLEALHGSWRTMERQLQLPEQLSASLDLATGTGKSYVLYGIAAIMLAEGVVDRVLVLCPSTTIENGLLEKFRTLASNLHLRDLLPPDVQVRVPRIIDASESIVEGTVCIENYHAVLKHVRSSIRDSLTGKGARTLVLNDEAHHVANESEVGVKRWKEFLLDPAYGFVYIIGVSGTCYVGNDYFTDVIYRYSLRQAIEERFVKRVQYVAEMPRTSDSDEKWQLVLTRHQEIRRRLQHQNIRPITIVVTKTIARCKDLAEEIKALLIERDQADPDSIDDRVLVIYNGAPDVMKLPYVDFATSKAEWIVSVSMLNEGWDVKRVFQIVPHEERAFNSKLLIAQVLGRGLRMPGEWIGEQPDVTIFNHDAWAPRIRQLVNEVLEIERRVYSHVIEDSLYHFELHNIDYTLETSSIKKPMVGEYTLFAKGYVDLATDVANEDVSIEFERADTGDRSKWQTQIERITYTPHEIAELMYSRLEIAQDPEHPDPRMRTVYTDEWSVERLEEIVKASLDRIGANDATESMRQKFLQSLGTLRRKTTETVRYTPIANRYFVIPTTHRQADSASAAELRSTKTLFFTPDSRAAISDDQVDFFDEVVEAGSGFKFVSVENPYDFKTPSDIVIADHDNEQRFIKMLLQPENVGHYDTWIKSTATRFYEIDYAWRKGNTPKRAKFSPDFFIKVENLIIVVEIKGDEELREPSEENRKKNEYALAHFRQVNDYLEQQGSPIRYKFTFLTGRNFNVFFQSLRENSIANFRSELDVKLLEEV